MTTRATEDEARVRPVRGPFMGKAWLTPRNVAWAAGGAVVLLFASLFFAFRAKPIPRRAEGAPPARLASKIAAAQDKLRADPQDIAALVELGTLLFSKGKDSYLEAINALEEARDLGALDPRVFYCLGVMYQEEGLFPFALSEYKRFLRHYPEDKEVRQLAAKLYYRMGLYPEAVNEYERLKFSDPDDALIEENLGLSLWGAKSVDRAKGSFETLLTRGGDFARRASFYLGQLALEAGDYPAAAERFLAAAEGGPLEGAPDERLHAGLGMSLQKLGRWEEAKASWEKVLAAVPNDPKAVAALREVNRKLAAAKKAAEAAERAAKRAADAAARAERLAAQKAAKKK
ncbi:MAG: tetratricopeptide repeat protein [Elusimicrobiota bacterium]|nr:tetratricopeptide repeat protein [Elusimicrobiota bacterium]